MDRDKLYEACYMQVYSYAVSLCRSSQLAEELTQETFFRAMRTEAAFRNQSSPFTWLCAIVRNLYADELRRRKKLDEMPEDISSGDDIETDLTDKDTAMRIHIILHAMEEPYKEVFQLRVFGELPFSEIAALFGKTETWARVTFHRARLKIRERMDANES